MPYFVDYDFEAKKFKSFYHTDRHKDIPDTAIQITDEEYLNASMNQKSWVVNPETKTLERKS